MKKVIKFYKQSCNPCDQVDAHLQKMGVGYESINAYDQPDVAAKYRIRSVPTVLVLNENGVEIARSVGYKPEILNDILQYGTKEDY